MLAFPSMLLGPAHEAGMKTPEDPDDYAREDYPHFYVFSMIQLGSALPYASAHWDNAKIIAAISNEDILKVTLTDLLSLGLHIRT